jgi:hypothetical protein
MTLCDMDARDETQGAYATVFHVGEGRRRSRSSYETLNFKQGRRGALSGDDDPLSPKFCDSGTLEGITTMLYQLSPISDYLQEAEDAPREEALIGRRRAHSAHSRLVSTSGCASLNALVQGAAMATEDAEGEEGMGGGPSLHHGRSCPPCAKLRRVGETAGSPGEEQRRWPLPGEGSQGGAVEEWPLAGGLQPRLAPWEGDYGHDPSRHLPPRMPMPVQWTPQIYRGLQAAAVPHAHHIMHRLPPRASPVSPSLLSLVDIFI